LDTDQQNNHSTPLSFVLVGSTALQRLQATDRLKNFPSFAEVEYFDIFTKKKKKKDLKKRCRENAIAILTLLLPGHLKGMIIRK
jgi:hypothetical protein